MEDISKFFTSKQGKNSSPVFSINADHFDKTLSHMVSSARVAMDSISKEANKAKDELNHLKDIGASKEDIEKAQQVYSTLYEELKKKTKEFEAEKQLVRDKALAIEQRHAEIAYKRLSKAEKAVYQREQADKIQEERKTVATKIAITEEAIKKSSKRITDLGKQKKETTDPEKLKEIDAELKAERKNKKALTQQKQTLSESSETLKQQEEKSRSDAKKLAGSTFGVKQSDKDAVLKERIAQKQQSVEQALLRTAQAREKLAIAEEKHQKNLAKHQKALATKAAALEKAKQSGTADEIKRAQAAYDNEVAKDTELADLKKELHEAELEEEEALAEEKAEINRQGISKSVGALVDAGAKIIDQNLDEMYGQQGRMMGRLQGSALDWADTVDDISDTIGMSGLVSKKSVINKMVELVDSGVAYNLEMRAFLAETSNNIASTFSATNGTLLRLIRLQQADTTAARLGMEASLTKLFNEMFQDTAYLAEDVADTVSSAILDASATMTKNDALEFEYTMQKWLGSLYSLGISDSAVSKIAEGINYLGTGNVSALNSNEDLQTLLAMAASRAGGKSYAEMLLGGITADDTNKLLRSMVEYLAEIASAETSYVTKSAYAELLGMSITDLKTFTSLTQQDLTKLTQTRETYDTLWSETKTQLNSIVSRIPLSTFVSNAFENIMVGAASNIGSNPITYLTWKAMGTIKDVLGKIDIPGVTAFGTGIASGIDLLNVLQGGMMGVSLIAEVISGASSLFNGGPANLDNWDFDEFTERGRGIQPLRKGTYETTSYSASLGVGSGSGSDVEASALSSGKDKASEVSGLSSEEMEAQQEVPQKIYEALGADKSVSVIDLLQGINDLLYGISIDMSGRVAETDIVKQNSESVVRSIYSESLSRMYDKARAESLRQNKELTEEQFYSTEFLTKGFYEILESQRSSFVKTEVNSLTNKLESITVTPQVTVSPVVPTINTTVTAPDVFLSPSFTVTPQVDVYPDVPTVTAPDVFLSPSFTVTPQVDVYPDVSVDATSSQGIALGVAALLTESLSTLHSVDINVAHILSNINPNRVFYTAITGALDTKGAQTAMQLQTEVAAIKATATNEQGKKTETTKTSSNVSLLDETITDLSTIIKNAIIDALRGTTVRTESTGSYPSGINTLTE